MRAETMLEAHGNHRIRFQRKLVMSITTLANGALIVLLVGWICYRQLQWKAVSVGRMWRFVVILAAVGFFQLATSTSHAALSGLDFGLLAIELVISLGVGSIMGAIAIFRPVSDQTEAAYAARADRRGRPSEPVDFESRTGWWGIGLWIVFILVRIGMDVLAGQAGSQLASSMGVILLAVAANRTARILVMTARLERLRSVATLPQRTA
jgi:hypothetical protein